MGFLNKLFGSKKNPEQKEQKSPFLPEKKEEIEVIFAEKFTQKGGKFIYSENSSTTDQYFKMILEENQWSPEEILCLDPHLSQRFQLDSPSEECDTDQYKALLIGCEYLIANKGTLLICNHQIRDYKLEQLPNFFIVFSGINNFVNDVSEGMSQLKSKYTHRLPTNITTLNVKNSYNENDFLSYGNSAKSLYLVLQEQ